MLRQQADAVMGCADRAAAHWQTAQSGARERATAIRLRGFGHLLKADCPAAIAAYGEALDLLRSSSAESVDVAFALGHLANAERFSSELAAAERDSREGLRLARTAGSAERVAGFTCMLAYLALDRKDWPGAETLAREALTLAKDVGRQILIACGCWMLAKALVRQGKPAEALPHAQRAVEIYTRLGLPDLTWLGHPDLEAARAILAECDG